MPHTAPEATRARVARAAAPWRLAAGGLVSLAVLGAAVGWLESGARRALAAGRERLLAADASGASRAFAAVHWPPVERRAAVGRVLAGCLAGGPLAGDGAPLEPPPLADLGFFEPEALLTQALARGDMAAAARLARALGAAGHPLGPLYEAAVLFDRGEDDEARRTAGGSPVPLTSRGIGARLSRAQALRSATGRTLVLDRSGEPVATRDAGGVLEPLPEALPLMGQVLARAEALGTTSSGAPALRLTADLELSRVAIHALGERRGSIVLVDPRDGAVRAAVSDAATARTEPAAAFEQRREPASIAKLITTAAAYRAGDDADSSIARMKCTGVERYGGQPLWCPWPTGPLAGLDQALAVSCNVAFANLAQRVGSERLVEELRRWGFDAPTGLLDAAGRIERLPDGPRQLADLAIGLELTDVTPLHAALLAAIVANHGRLAEPHLVAGGSGALGLTAAPVPRRDPHPVIDAAVAARLARAMQAVARYGTAAGLAPPGLSVAMKTGTASTPRIGYHVNYVGFAPAEAPVVCFCVRVTGRASSRAVNEDAHEVMRRLLAALRDRLPSERQALLGR